MDELKPCHFRQVDNHGRILCSVIKGGDREVSLQLCRACPVSQINCQNLRAGLEKKTSTPITVRFATGRVEVWDDTPPTIEFKQAACAAKTMPIHSPRDCAGCLIRLPNVVPATAIQVAHRSKQAASAPAPSVTNARAASPQRASRAPGRVAQPTTAVAAQPIAQAAARSAAQSQSAAAYGAPAKAQPPSIDVDMASDLIARARATADRKAEEKRQREIERLAQEQQAQIAAQAETENKPKIIQMKEWLASQMNKKAGAEPRANSPYKPQAVQPDADGVSDIIYSPLGMQAAAGAYQETIDYERCVGWTD